MVKIKNYRAEFKFKVALEMIRGDLSIAEIISKYSVPRSAVSRWEKQLMDSGACIYKKGNISFSNSSDIEVDKLHKVIGKLKV